jgi:biopolymer transport protein TolR
VTIKASKHKRRLVAEINVVPYIDVMLVLLIVFMVTAPLLMQGVKVELPNAPSAPLGKNDRDPLIVSIKADGTFYLELGNGRNMEEPLTSIIKKVKKVLRQEPKTSVLVWGDASVRYGSVVRLMSDLQNAGAPSVGLVTEPLRKN